MVFEELQRYNTISARFGGFEWGAFVRKWKVLKKDSLDKRVVLGEEFKDEKLFDIDELVKAMEKEGTEEKKEEESE